MGGLRFRCGSTAVRTRILGAFLLAVAALPASAPPALARGAAGEEDELTGFRSLCSFSRSLQVDPIVSYGRRSAHLHDFFGTAPDQFATYDSLRASDTLCKLVEDTAGYWVPSLYAPDGQGNPVKVDPDDVIVYYNGPTDPAITAHPFPPNLKMIAGDGKAPPESQDLDKIWYDCGPGEGAESERAFAPYLCSGGMHVRAHVLFPSCWDGVAPAPIGDDSAHVIYPQHDYCPEGYLRLPTIHLQVKYPLSDGRGVTLASGGGPSDPDSVYTMHGDFFNAWEPATLDTLVADCLNEQGPPLACGIAKTPFVEGVAPIRAPVGATVTISGDYFVGTESVTFDGKPVTFSVTSDKSIRATVPAGATEGLVAVTSDGQTGAGIHTTGYSSASFVPVTTADDFDRVIAGGWGKSETGHSWTTVGGNGADYAVSGNSGQMTLTAENSARLAHLALPGTSQEMWFRFKVNKMPTTKRINAYGVARYSSATGSFYSVMASVGWNGTFGISATKQPASGPEAIIGPRIRLGEIFAPMTWYWVRARVVDELPGVRIQGKVWKEGNPEPTNWQFSHLDVVSPLTGSGFVGLRASRWGTPKSVVSFDEFTAIST